MTPADRLRSLVKEATPHPWPYITATFPGQPLSSDMADRQLMYLAPQLAELVADMAEALNEVLSDGDLPDDETDAMVVAALAHLAALFPEDSA